MFPVRNYLKDAKRHETVFRNILRSYSKEFRNSAGIDPEAPVKEIFESFSAGDRCGKWTILNFKRGPYDDSLLQLTENDAIIATENVATLSGSGRIDKYRIKSDGSVEFDINITSWLS